MAYGSNQTRYAYTTQRRKCKLTQMDDMKYSNKDGFKIMKVL